MPNKRGKGQSKGANQQVNQLLQALLNGVKNQKKQTKKGKNAKNGAKPHFPLAPAGDIRHAMTPYEASLCLQNLNNLFKQGAGQCTLIDSGGVNYTVSFMLPTQHTVRLLNASNANN